MDSEREALRVELERRADARRAEALTDTQALERKLEREAREEIAQDGRITYASARERRSLREVAIARRRDALTRAMDYPMTGAELVAACQHATLTAKVPAAAFEDVSQALAAEVIARHGRTPTRAKVAAQWLKRRALSIHIDQQRATERATGAKATAEQLEQWQESDARAATGSAMSGDFIWHLAAQRPAPERTEPMTAERVASMLGVSPGQARAVALAINTRQVRPLTSTERVQWLNARRAILKRYPDTLALRLTIRPESYALELLMSAAIRTERKRADIAARWGGSRA
jgi:hypothetical protein